MRILLVSALVVLAAGCAVRAQYVRADDGGYDLVTGARSSDEALVRFRRTAQDLCGERYDLGELAILPGSERPAVATSNVTRGPDYTAHLSCRL